MKLLVNAPTGDQQIIEVGEGGGYFDETLILWDERVDGPLPEITLGAMIKVDDTLVFDQPRLDAHIAASAPPVPLSVTRRQARQALLLAGLIDSVPVAIAGITDATARRMAEIEWEDSQEFERHRPLLVSLAGALGMTNKELDELFVLASSL